MQVQLNLQFDLETVAGQRLFARLQNALVPDDGERVMVLSDDGSNIPAQADPAPVPPNTPSPTARQEAAAKARAAKTAKQAPPPDDLNGGPGTGNGALDDPGDQLIGDDPDPDDLGLSDPSMSPAEAKEAGIVLVRQMYAAQKVAEVKKLQKEWSIAKFYDVPVERGHEFYRAVLAISHKVMGPQA